MYRSSSGGDPCQCGREGTSAGPVLDAEVEGGGGLGSGAAVDFDQQWRLLPRRQLEVLSRCRAAIRIGLSSCLKQLKARKSWGCYLLCG